jgi:uncharacterized protein (TIGR00369 family)
LSKSDLALARELFSGFDTPPCAATLGWELLNADISAGSIEIGFEGKREFCNPNGHIQGGFLAAMLDDTMGPAIVVKSNGTAFAPTIALNVTFIAPAQTGKIVGKGRIVHLGKSICSLEAELFQNDTLIARATASARLIEMQKALGKI